METKYKGEVLMNRFGIKNHQTGEYHPHHSTCNTLFPLPSYIWGSVKCVFVTCLQMHKHQQSEWIRTADGTWPFQPSNIRFLQPHPPNSRGTLSQVLSIKEPGKLHPPWNSPLVAIISRLELSGPFFKQLKRTWKRRKGENRSPQFLRGVGGSWTKDIS